MIFKVFLHKIYFFSSTLTAFIIPEAMFSFSVSFLEFRGQKTSTKVNGVGYCNAGWWVRGVQILLYTPRMGYLRSMGCFIFICSDVLHSYSLRWSLSTFMVSLKKFFWSSFYSLDINVSLFVLKLSSLIHGLPFP